MGVYRELEAWKTARALTVRVYRLTAGFPQEERFGLISQMRRCAVSVPSNIAEGYGRSTDKDRRHFLHIARGSLYELETQVFLAVDLGFISEEQCNEVLAEQNQCARLLQGLIRSLKTN